MAPDHARRYDVLGRVVHDGDKVNAERPPRIVKAMSTWDTNTDITETDDDTPVFSGAGETDAA